ncbi:MAG: formamidopyrimidine-DNA glycosylase [Candidatus Cloacimonadota bacterium]|nr:MAG: formamidopyrimidine-DNA glycosylase [Candidatus Cloacimonadota bacterium]
MPELPEVETIRKELLNAGFLNKRVIDFKCHWENILENGSEDKFRKYLLNNKLLNISRRAKYLIFEFENSKNLIVHLRMTGQFTKPKTQYEKKDHEHIHIKFNDNRWLVYKDTRKFGKFTLVENLEKHFKEIGPEPLEKGFTDLVFDKALGNTKGNIKSRLLNQKVIAGLGNIYVDEALFLAKILPIRLVCNVSKKERKLLRVSIQKVLQDGLDNMGTSLGTGETNYLSVSGRRGKNQQRLKVFRREKLECFECQTIIKKEKIASRGTHFCPSCQS